MFDITEKTNEILNNYISFVGSNASLSIDDYIKIRELAIKELQNKVSVTENPMQMQRNANKKQTEQKPAVVPSSIPSTVTSTQQIQTTTVKQDFTKENNQKQGFIDLSEEVQKNSEENSSPPASNSNDKTNRILAMMKRLDA